MVWHRRLAGASQCGMWHRRLAGVRRCGMWHQRLAGARRAGPVLDAKCQIRPPPKSCWSENPLSDPSARNSYPATPDSRRNWTEMGISVQPESPSRYGPEGTGQVRLFVFRSSPGAAPSAGGSGRCTWCVDLDWTIRRVRVADLAGGPQSRDGDAPPRGHGKRSGTENEPVAFAHAFAHAAFSERLPTARISAHIVLR